MSGEKSPTVRTAPLQRAVAQAIQNLLRPVVRRLVAWGLPYPALDQIVRELYVEVAERDFALSFKQPTDSRVSLLTGLHRKEVARLRHAKRGRSEVARLETSVAARVIGRWMSPPYVDAGGRALALAYESRTPRARSFARIVHDLGVDAPARSVLDELLRMEIVSLGPGGLLSLDQEALVPKGDLAAKLDLLGIDPAELFGAIAHNIEAPGDLWLQRKVVYDNVGSDALAEIRRAASELGAEFVRRANELLGSRDRDRNPAASQGTRSRVSLGVYYFQEPVDDASLESARSATAATTRRKPRPAPHRTPASRKRSR